MSGVLSIFEVQCLDDMVPASGNATDNRVLEIEGLRHALLAAERTVKYGIPPAVLYFSMCEHAVREISLCTMTRKPQYISFILSHA